MHALARHVRPLRATALLLPLVLTGCRTVVHAPAVVERPTPVHLAHYARYHASLVIPGEGVATEYTYGDRDLFARYDHSLWPSIKGMAFPTQGVLGRRTVAWDGRDIEALRAALDNLDSCERISTLFVAAADLERLRTELDQAYRRSIATEIHNESVDIRFVEYDASYTFLHNCNHELAGWLERLGCRVSGGLALARFEVRAGPAAPTQPEAAVARLERPPAPDEPGTSARQATRPDTRPAGDELPAFIR